MNEQNIDIMLWYQEFIRDRIAYLQNMHDDQVRRYQNFAQTGLLDSSTLQMFMAEAANIERDIDNLTADLKSMSVLKMVGEFYDEFVKNYPITPATRGEWYPRAQIVDGHATVPISPPLSLPSPLRHSSAILDDNGKPPIKYAILKFASYPYGDRDWYAAYCAELDTFYLA